MQRMNYALLTPSQLAQHLRAIRRAQGLSQTQLGLRLGLSQSRVARMEKSPTHISVDALLQMLEALGVQVVLSVPSQQRTQATAHNVASTSTDQGDW